MGRKTVKVRPKNKLLERVRVVTQILFMSAPFLLIFMVKMNPDLKGLDFQTIIETHPVILISLMRLCCLPFMAYILYKMDYYTQSVVNDWSVMLSLFLLIASLLLLGQVYFAALIVALIFAFSNKVTLKWQELKETPKRDLLKQCIPSLVMLLVSILIFFVAKRVGL